jgi:hypothetical protein
MIKITGETSQVALTIRDQRDPADNQERACNHQPGDRFQVFEKKRAEDDGEKRGESSHVFLLIIKARHF